MHTLADQSSGVTLKCGAWSCQFQPHSRHSCHERDLCVFLRPTLLRNRPHEKGRVFEGGGFESLIRAPSNCGQTHMHVQTCAEKRTCYTNHLISRSSPSPYFASPLSSTHAHALRALSPTTIPLPDTTKSRSLSKPVTLSTIAENHAHEMSIVVHNLRRPFWRLYASRLSTYKAYSCRSLWRKRHFMEEFLGCLEGHQRMLKEAARASGTGAAAYEPRVTGKHGRLVAESQWF